MQRKVIDVLEGLSQEFGDRISSVVWDSFAFLGTVPDPTVEVSILSRQESLTHPYWNRRFLPACGRQGLSPSSAYGDVYESCRSWTVYTRM